MKIPPDIKEKKSWLLTFNDLITLLLTFFVLIISLSSLNVEKVMMLGDSLRTFLGREKDAPEKVIIFEPFVTPSIDQDIEKEKARRAKEGIKPTVPRQTEGLSRFIDGVRQIPDMKTREVNGNLYLSLPESFLFSPGSAKISDHRKDDMARLAVLLKEAPGEIVVAGHTDNVPIKGGPYRSNWELSTARAVNLVKFLIDHGIDPERLSAVGYGDAKPVASNDLAEGRAQNRRVELLILFKEM